MIVRAGSTVRIKNKITDFDGSPLTPDTHEIMIYDNEGELKDTITDPNLEVEGTYYFDYILPNPVTNGNWKIIWKIVVDSKPDVDVFEFNVVEV